MLLLSNRLAILIVSQSVYTIKSLWCTWPVLLWSYSDSQGKMILFYPRQRHVSRFILFIPPPTQIWVLAPQSFFLFKWMTGISYCWWLSSYYSHDHWSDGTVPWRISISTSFWCKYKNYSSSTEQQCSFTQRWFGRDNRDTSWWFFHCWPFVWRYNLQYWSL